MLDHTGCMITRLVLVTVEIHWSVVYCTVKRIDGSNESVVLRVYFAWTTLYNMYALICWLLICFGQELVVSLVDGCIYEVYLCLTIVQL